MPILPEKKSWKNGHFGSKPRVNPFEKISIFLSFWTFFFYSLERRFFVLEYYKRHFPNLYSLKKTKLEKWPFLEHNHWKNVNFSTFWTSCFYSLENRFFVLEIIKDIFLAYIALKKKFEKRPFFGPKQWVNPSGKMSIFRLFELLLFIA